MNWKTKTKHKIFLIISTSAITYILFHGILFIFYDFIIDDIEHVCFALWIKETSIHISNHTWNTRDGIGEWSSAAEGMEERTVNPDDLRNNSGFIFWHMVLPTFTIVLT